VHNTRDLGCGRVMPHFPKIIARLEDILKHFLTTLDCVDVTFVSNEILDHLPLPSMGAKPACVNSTSTKPRIRSVLAAVLALAASPWLQRDPTHGKGQGRGHPT
jgi:hypothetical protein